MTFDQQVLAGVFVAVGVFVVLSAVTLIGQRGRRRRSIHWFAIFVLSSVIGAMTGIGIHLSGTEPLDTPITLLIDA